MLVGIIYTITEQSECNSKYTSKKRYNQMTDISRQNFVCEGQHTTGNSCKYESYK